MDATLVSRPAGRLGYTPGARERWERSGSINVGRAERIVSAIGGGLLAFYGISRADLPGAAMAVAGGALLHRGGSGHCIVFGALGLSTAGEGRLGLAARRGDAAEAHRGRTVRIEEAITVMKPPRELYAFWRDLRNMPRAMRHIVEVTDIDGRRSHWKAKAPGGLTAEWDAIITHDVPDERIAWRSIDVAALPNSGEVRFRPVPGGHGTEVRLTLEYEPPAGAMGRFAAGLLGQVPGMQVRDDLRKFKQTVEAGEIPTTSGQPAGEA